MSIINERLSHTTSAEWWWQVGTEAFWIGVADIAITVVFTVATGGVGGVVFASGRLAARAARIGARALRSLGATGARSVSASFFMNYVESTRTKADDVFVAVLSILLLRGLVYTPRGGSSILAKVRNRLSRNCRAGTCR